jgi:hypothetical protein
MIKVKNLPKHNILSAGYVRVLLEQNYTLSFVGPGAELVS